MLRIALQDPMLVVTLFVCLFIYLHRERERERFTLYPSGCFHVGSILAETEAAAPEHRKAASSTSSQLKRSKPNRVVAIAVQKLSVITATAQTLRDGLRVYLPVPALNDNVHCRIAYVFGFSRAGGRRRSVSPRFNETPKTLWAKQTTTGLASSSQPSGDFT